MAVVATERPVVWGEVAGRCRHTITHHRIMAEARAVEVRGRTRGSLAFHPLAGLDRSRLTTETRKLLDAAGVGEEVMR